MEITRRMAADFPRHWSPSLGLASKTALWEAHDGVSRAVSAPKGSPHSFSDRRLVALAGTMETSAVSARTLERGRALIAEALKEAKTAAEAAKLDFTQYALKLRPYHFLYWCAYSGAARRL